jgi:plasmid maintenance system antidote protein VapI
VLRKRAVTADTALRLARYFGTSEQFWMTPQSSFELEEARNRSGSHPKQIEHASVAAIIRPIVPATLLARHPREH